MSTKEYAERASRALEGSGLAEPVSATFGENRIAVLCRIHKNNEKKWLALITKIMMAAQSESKEAHAWACHICQNYFLKEVHPGDQKLVWGWNFSIQSKEMGAALDRIIRLIKGQPLEVNKNEVMEFPLHAPKDRNAPKQGKGVHTVGGSQGDFSPARKS